VGGHATATTNRKKIRGEESRYAWRFSCLVGAGDKEGGELLRWQFNTRGSRYSRYVSVSSSR